MAWNDDDTPITKPPLDLSATRMTDAAARVFGERWLSEALSHSGGSIVVRYRDAMDRVRNITVGCPCGDDDPQGCALLFFGYVYCRGCGEHHRPPVALSSSEACPVDLLLQPESSGPS